MKESRKQMMCVSGIFYVKFISYLENTVSILDRHQGHCMALWSIKIPSLTHMKTETERQLSDRKGGGEWAGEEPNHTTTRKHGPL
jgi:hypothetical protein